MSIGKGITIAIATLFILLPFISANSAEEQGLKFEEQILSELEEGEFEMNLIRTGPNSLIVELRFGPPSIHVVEMKEEIFAVLTFDGSSPSGSPGKPMLPAINIPLAVPAGPSGITIVSSIDLDLGPIFPLQEASPDLTGVEPSVFIIDEDYYTSPMRYPNDRLKGHSGMMGDVPFRMLQVTPASIREGSGKVSWAMEIHVELSWNSDRLPEVDANSPFINIYPRIFSNWDSFDHVNAPAANNARNGNGCDYIIISHPDLLNASMSLAGWKNQMGIETRVYDLDQIGHDREQIREFILHTYENFDPRPYYVLFMGDSDLVPTNYMKGHPYDRALTGTDLYYATVSGSDHVPDIFTGRIPANNASQAQMIVSKVIDYERTPPHHSGFYDNVTLAAYFQDSNNDGYADRRFAQTSEEAYSFMNSLGYNASRIFYAKSSVDPLYWNLGTYSNGESIPPELLRSNGFEWAGSSSNISDAFHDGSFLITHRDHGGTGGWGKPKFASSDVRGLHNGDLLPVVYSINCLTGYFDNETSDGPFSPSEESFAEHLINQKGGGAVGVVAATRVSYSGHNDYFYKGLYDAMFPSLNTTLGNATPLFRMGEVLNYAKYFMSATWGDPWGIDYLEYELFHYLGDPTMELWTSQPIDLNASHASYLQMGTTLVQVHSAVENATVCISRNHTILGVEGIRNGTANITVDGLQAGDITVTITRHDHRPYISSIRINATMADLCVDSIEVDRSGIAGVNWTVESIISNSGSIDLSSINVTLELDGVEMNSTSIASLISGDTKAVRMNFTPLNDGWHTVGIRVENKNESIAWNNLLEERIKVHSDPDMILDPEDTMEIWWRTGEEHLFNISVENRGHGRLDYELEDRVLFAEGFSTTELNTTRWDNDTLSLGIGTNGLYPPSYPYSLDLVCGENITSMSMDTSNYTDLEISYHVEMGGMLYYDEAVDLIYLEYLNESHQWIRVSTDTGDYYQNGFFSLREIDLPPDASHPDFRFRFVTESTGDNFGNGPGVFSLDDIYLSHTTPSFWLEGINTSWSLGHMEGGNISIMVNCTSLPVGNHSTYISLISNDDDGFHSIPLDLEVRENVTPMANAGVGMVIDQHEEALFNGSGSADNVGVVNWTWYLDDGIKSLTLYGSEVSHIFHEAGGYEVRLTVRDRAWNVDTDVIQIIVNDITDPIANAGRNISVDQHEEVTLNGSSSRDNVGVTNWTWSIDTHEEIVVLYGCLTRHVFHIAGEHIVNLTVKDGMNNLGYDMMTVKVNDTTEPTTGPISSISADQHELFLLDGTNASDNVEVINWTWDIEGESTLLYGEEASHIIHEAGSYPARLNISDGEGNRCVSSFLILIRDITLPDVGEWKDMELEQGGTLSLNGTICTDNVGIVNWTWHISLNGENLTCYGPELEMNMYRAGTCFITLTVKDAAGNCANATFRVRVLDTESPIAVIDGDIDIEQHQNLILDGSGSTDNVGVSNYSWNVSGEEVRINISGHLLNITMDHAGDHIVTLTVKDIRGNTGEHSIIVHIIDITKPILDLGPDMDVHVNDTIHLFVNFSFDNVGIANHTWSIHTDTGLIDLYGPEPNLTIGLSGVYELKLTVTDHEGNTAVDTLLIYVHDQEGGGTDDDDTPTDDEGGEDEMNDDRTSYRSITLLIILALLLIILLIVIFFMIKRSGSEEDEIMSWEGWEE